LPLLEQLREQQLLSPEQLAPFFPQVPTSEASLYW
jgi:hypothetical protein